jgi:hypothetical protein
MSEFIKRGVIGFLVLALFLIALSGCRSGPRITWCALDSSGQKMDCMDPDGVEFSIPLEQANNYLCSSPQDAKRLLDACFEEVRRR